MTQASHVPVTRTSTISSEEARARYLDRQIRDMISVRLPSKIPSMEEESLTSTDLTRRIDTFCREQKREKKKGEGIS